MLNMDTMRVGSPPARHPRVLSDPLLPTIRGGDPTLSTAERIPETPAAEAKSPNKKGTLRFFLREHRLKKRRKKELLQELADLKREHASLQSEFTNAKLILSELKQEYLNELEKASRARVLQRKNETQVQSSACQTDPFSPALREFKAVPRKNYAFIYNVFTVPTPEQLKRSLDKFQKSGSKVAAKDEDRERARDDAENDASTDVPDDAKIAIQCDAENETKEREAVKALEADADRTAAELNKEGNEPANHFQGSIAAKENSVSGTRIEPVAVRSSLSATVNKLATKEKSTISFSSYNSDRSAQSAAAEPAGRPSLPAQARRAEEVTEERGRELKEPETTPSQITSKANVITDEHCMMPEEAAQAQPAVVSKRSTEALKDTPNWPDASKDSRRDGGSKSGLVQKVPAESSIASDRSSESSLLLKLRQAISNVAATLEPDAKSPKPDSRQEVLSPRQAPQSVNHNSQTLYEMVQHGSTGEEGVTSRRFLPPNNDEVRALRDPGRKEFEKRRRVSCSTLRPPLHKAIGMNGALCCHTESLGGVTPTFSRQDPRRTPATTTGTPGLWSIRMAGPAMVPATDLLTMTTPPPFSSTAPMNAQSASDRDPLTSDSEPDTDCAADDYESSTEFHGSEKNVAKTALHNRMSGFNRGMSQASGRSTFNSDAMTATMTGRTPTLTKKKSFRKKKNSSRRATSARPSSSSSSSDQSRGTSRRWRRLPSAAGTRTPSTYSATSTATTSRATTAMRPPSSVRPLSPIALLSGTVTDSDASRPTTAIRRKEGASSRATARTASRATSTAASSPQPTPRSRAVSRATTASSFLSTPQVDLSSSDDMTSSESEATTTPTTPRQFLPGYPSEQGFVHAKRSIFENLSSAGYTHVDDRVPVWASKGSEGQRSGGFRGSGQKVFAAQDKMERAQMPPSDHSRDPKKKSTFVVQRAELYAPFPPKIMRSLLPSFIDVDPSVRPDMVPNPMAFDHGRHGDEKSTSPVYKGHCPHKASTSPSKLPRPPPWEDMQSYLLPAFYSFSDDSSSTTDDQANRKTTRFDLGEAI